MPVPEMPPPPGPVPPDGPLPPAPAEAPPPPPGLARLFRDEGPSLAPQASSSIPKASTRASIVSGLAMSGRSPARKTAATLPTGSGCSLHKSGRSVRSHGRTRRVRAHIARNTSPSAASRPTRVRWLELSRARSPAALRSGRSRSHRRGATAQRRRRGDLCRSRASAITLYATVAAAWPRDSPCCTRSRRHASGSTVMSTARRSSRSRLRVSP